MSTKKRPKKDFLFYRSHQISSLCRGPLCEESKKISELRNAPKVGANEGITHETRYCTVLSVTAFCSQKPCFSLSLLSISGTLSAAAFSSLIPRSALRDCVSLSAAPEAEIHSVKPCPDRKDGILFWDRGLLFETGFGSLWDCIEIALRSSWNFAALYDYETAFFYLC